MGALLGAPLWLIVGKGPPDQLASAALALALGYVLGHMMQLFAKAHLPEGEQPSFSLLQPDSRRLPVEFKKLLLAKVKARFQLEIVLDTPNEGLVAEAFRLCRQDLLNTDRAGYVEQFQGLYAMMRGFALAFGLGTAYLGGLSIAASREWSPGSRWCGFQFLIGWVLLALVRGVTDHKSRFVNAVELVAALGSVVWLGAQAAWWTAGYSLRHYHQPLPSNTPAAAAAAALGCTLFAAQCWKAYRHNQAEFALAVYRGFLVDKPTKKADP